MIRYLSYIFFGLLGGCSFEPRYARPAMENFPFTWKYDAEEGPTLANARWWECFEDPVLNDLILIGLANNKDLKIAMWRVCEYLARYQVARSNFFPKISLQATALKEKLPVSTSFLPFGFNPITPFYQYSFNASYEVDFWGKIRSQVRAANAEALAQIENRRVVVLTLVSSIANSYVFLREYDKELEIAKKTAESRKESLDLSNKRFLGGLTSEIEVVQAAAAYEETLADITNLELQIQEEENLLSLLIGEPSGDICRGRAVDELVLPIEIPAGLPSELLVRRPDIMSAENLLIAANAQIGVARANFFPQITLTGSYGGQSFQLNELFSSSARTWSFGANMDQPIFTGGELTGELYIAEAQRGEALYHYYQVILNAFREVNDALIAHEQAKKLVQIESDRVKVLKEYLHLSWVRYYNGQTEYLTYLDAERHLYSGEISLAQAQGNVFVTLINLYKALGGGWVYDADCNLRPG